MFLSFHGFNDIFRLKKKSCFWYRCYYPHWSRESLSPVCGIFFFSFTFYVSMMLTAQTKRFCVSRMHIWHTGVARLSYKQPWFPLINSLSECLFMKLSINPFTTSLFTVLFVLQDLRCWNFDQSISFSNMCHISYDACHVTCVICHVSNIMCRMSHVICKSKNKN